MVTATRHGKYRWLNALGVLYKPRKEKVQEIQEVQEVKEVREIQEIQKS